jgi:hypothetical protein
MPGTGDVDYVKIMPIDHAIQMHVNEVEPRGCAPVAEQARLYVLGPQWLAQ